MLKMEAALSSETSMNLYRHTQKTVTFRFKSYPTEKRTQPKSVNHKCEVEFDLNFEIDVKPYADNTEGNTLLCRVDGATEHHTIMLTYFVLGSNFSRNKKQAALT
jgi:hypothetical protein